VSGIELDSVAAATARGVTPDVTVGDPAEITLPPASFDVVTAFHVVEHLPDPATALRNMLAWLAPGGLLIVEVPNVGGWGGATFGRFWSGLDFPRHLIHFTPATMRALVERCGGVVVDEWHWSKPRWIIRSARFALAARGTAPARAALAALDSRAGGGLVKLVLEVARLADGLRRHAPGRAAAGRAAGDAAAGRRGVGARHAGGGDVDAGRRGPAAAAAHHGRHRLRRPQPVDRARHRPLLRRRRG